MTDLQQTAPSYFLTWMTDTMYIDTKFSPQPYGVATKKGSDLSDYVNDLVKKWAEDGTLDKLVEDNGVQPSYVEEAN